MKEDAEIRWVTVMAAGKTTTLLREKDRLVSRIAGFQAKLDEKDDKNNQSNEIRHKH